MKGGENLQKLLLFLIFVIIAFNIVDVFLGKNSFFRMVKLKEDLKVLNKKVLILKKENAKLQKEYFELKELESGQ